MLNELPARPSEPVSLDTILLFDLKEVLQQYEEEIFSSLYHLDYEHCEKLLMEFCMKMLELPEKEQLFTVRIFFVSFIIDILRVQIRKGPLHPDALTHAYDLIYEIEQWGNISEFMLHIPSLMNRLENFIITDYLIFIGNKHVEDALLLINEYLHCKHLNVNWLAQQLNISPTHLTNLFKQYFKVTASCYIEQKKIEAMIDELKNTNKTLKEVREEFGFTNHSYFIQFFKKNTGLTPLQYLQKLN